MKKLLALAPILLFLFPLAVNAETRSETVRDKINDKMETRQVTNDTRVAQRCELVKDAVLNRSRNSLTIAENHQQRLDNISQAAQDYYQTHYLDNGKSLDNYEQLATNLAAKKRYVEANMTQTQSQLGEFNCNGDPLTNVREYKNTLQTSTNALKEYKLAVKDMLQALRGGGN